MASGLTVDGDVGAHIPTFRRPSRHPGARSRAGGGGRACTVRMEWIHELGRYGVYHHQSARQIAAWAVAHLDDQRITAVLPADIYDILDRVSTLGAQSAGIPRGQYHAACAECRAGCAAADGI